MGCREVTRRPRLLLLTPDFPPATGGIQELLGGLVEELREYEVTVVARSSGDDAEWIPPRPYRIRRLGAAGRVGLLGPSVAGAVLGLCTRPDIVVVGHVVCMPAALLLRRARGIPFVVYLYADELPNHRRMLVAGMREAAAAIAISRHTRDLAAALGARVDTTTIIPPGVRLPALSTRPAGRQPGLMLTVARLSDRYKGHDLVLEALVLLRTSVPSVRWIVIGDGPLRAGLEARARELGVADLVVFAGRLNDAERDAWLRRAQVFVMPSRLPPTGLGGEGFGIVYLQAAAHGLPVVAGAVGGALDAVRDGETGFLIDPTSPEAIAQGVARIMTDPVLGERMGDAGRHFAATHAYPVVARRVSRVLADAMRF